MSLKGSGLQAVLQGWPMKALDPFSSERQLNMSKSITDEQKLNKQRPILFKPTIRAIEFIVLYLLDWHEELIVYLHNARSMKIISDHDG